jgi:hypothetical protein
MCAFLCKKILARQNELIEIEVIWYVQLSYENGRSKIDETVT